MVCVHGVCAGCVCRHVRLDLGLGTVLRDTTARETGSKDLCTQHTQGWLTNLWPRVDLTALLGALLRGTLLLRLEWDDGRWSHVVGGKGTFSACVAARASVLAPSKTRREFPFHPREGGVGAGVLTAGSAAARPGSSKARLDPISVPPCLFGMVTCMGRWRCGGRSGREANTNIKTGLD